MTRLFTCKDFYVEEVTENLPDGTSRQKTYAVGLDAAGIIALDEMGRILITREYRPKISKWVWRIPAGRKQENEGFDQAARRELREEVGFDARELEKFSEYSSSSSWVKQNYAIYIARGLYPSPLDTGDEVIRPEIHFMTRGQVMALLNNGELKGDVAAVLYRFLCMDHK